MNLELRIMGIEQPDHMKYKQHRATCVFTSVSVFKTRLITLYARVKLQH